MSCLFNYHTLELGSQEIECGTAYTNLNPFSTSGRAQNVFELIIHWLHSDFRNVPITCM